MGDTHVWLGTTDALWTTAANWEPAGPPADTDSIIFDERGQDNCHTFGDLDAVGFVSVIIAKGFKYSLGVSDGKFDPGANAGNAIDTLRVEGGLNNYIEAADGATIAAVYVDTASGSENACNLEGIITTVDIVQGKVTFDTVTCASNIRMQEAAGHKTKLTIGASSTLTNSTIYLEGGQVSTSTTVATVRQTGGKFHLNDASAMTLLEQEGGEFYWNGTGTITAANIHNGLFSTAMADKSKTLTNMSMWEPATVDFSRSHNITFSNALKIFGGRGPRVPVGATLTVVL
jgi:hypothetical protein